jgi:hypothetical protein
VLVFIVQCLLVSHYIGLNKQAAFSDSNCHDAVHQLWKQWANARQMMYYIVFRQSSLARYAWRLRV